MNIHAAAAAAAATTTTITTSNLLLLKLLSRYQLFWDEQKGYNELHMLLFAMTSV